MLSTHSLAHSYELLLCLWFVSFFSISFCLHRIHFIPFQRVISGRHHSGRQEMLKSVCACAFFASEYEVVCMHAHISVILQFMFSRNWVCRYYYHLLKKFFYGTTVKIAILYLFRFVWVTGMDFPSRSIKMNYFTVLLIISSRKG